MIKLNLFVNVRPHVIKDLCLHKDTIILANKHSESLFTHKNQKRSMRLQRSQSQIYLSFQLLDLPLYGISSKQILFQDCARPSSKGSGVNTIYPISYGQNSIKIIE